VGEDEVDEVVGGVDDEAGDQVGVALVGIVQPGIAPGAEWVQHGAADESEGGGVVGDRRGVVAGGGVGVSAFAQPAEQVPVGEVAGDAVAVAAGGRDGGDELGGRVDGGVFAGPGTGFGDGAADGGWGDGGAVGPQVGKEFVAVDPVRVQGEVDDDFEDPVAPLVRDRAGGVQVGRSEDADQRPWRCGAGARGGGPQGEVVVELGILLLHEQQPPLRRRVDQVSEGRHGRERRGGGRGCRRPGRIAVPQRTGAPGICWGYGGVRVVGVLPVVGLEAGLLLGLVRCLAGGRKAPPSSISSAHICECAAATAGWSGAVAVPRMARTSWASASGICSTRTCAESMRLTAAGPAAESRGGTLHAGGGPAEEPGRPVPVRSSAATDLGRRFGCAVTPGPATRSASRNRPDGATDPVGGIRSSVRVVVGTGGHRARRGVPPRRP
jgi:hypothetical protein